MKKRKGRNATRAELRRMANSSPSAKKISRYIGHNFCDRWVPRLGGFNVKASTDEDVFLSRTAAMRVARQVKRSLQEFA